MQANKHPKALSFLFFSEMWERFGYYLMIGIFTLYLKDAKHGFGMDENEASDLYGTFIAFVFLTPFIGGLLADRILGIGYCLMAVHDKYALYVAMLLVILGNGFFKPNISTLLGNVYNDEKYIHKKDAGYNLFYMGINIGAFVCNFFGAALYNIYGWPAAFLAAGVGMFIGITIFWVGTKHYAHADVIKGTAKNDMPLINIFGVILLPAVGFGLLALLLPEPLFGSKTTDAFLFGCIPVLFFYGRLWYKSPEHEKRPIGAMLAIFVVAISFWAVFKQNGSTLNTWADRFTDREVPHSIQPAISALYLAEEITYQKDSIPILDKQFRLLDKKHKTFGYPPYFKNIPKEKLPAEGEKIYAFNTNIFQSVNPFWVVSLTPLVLAFFAFLSRRGMEPTTPTKMAIGLLISGLSCLVMVGAVYACNNGEFKSSPLWFISSYFVITIGELFLSPMGLSLVSKLSPPRLTSLMMGGWFLATSIGNKMSGVLSSMWDGYYDKSNFFYVNTALLCSASLLMFLMLRWLNKIFAEYK